MNKALVFLYWTLLRRKVLHFCRDLRRPVNLISALIVCTLLGVLVYHRNDAEFVKFITRVPLWFVLSLLFVVSLCRGFMQRGLVFESADVEFLFTGPFREYHLVFYRLLPGYLYSFITAAAVFGLVGPHLEHPLLVTLCIVLFQIISFHFSAAVSILAGSLSPRLYSRLYKVLWALLGCYTAGCFYAFSPPDDLPRPASRFRTILSSDSAQILFYPAVTVVDFGTSRSLRDQAFYLLRPIVESSRSSFQVWLSLVTLAAGLGVSLIPLVRLKANLIESSLSTAERISQPGRRTQNEKAVPARRNKRFQTVPYPKLRLFRGWAAIIWKNQVCARRSKTQLLLALAYTIVLTVPWVCLLRIMGRFPDAADPFALGAAIPLSIGFIPVLLQTTLPFDFRMEGQRLLELRTLPVSSLRAALAVIAVPALLCLTCQALSFLSLNLAGRFQLETVLMVICGYPSIAIGVSAVWNIHHLLFVSNQSGGVERPNATKAEGALMVLAMAFAIFFPAGFVLKTLSSTPTLAGSVAIAIQYAVDACLVRILAHLFDRFEGHRVR
jgi:hypothetical protein